MSIVVKHKMNEPLNNLLNKLMKKLLLGPHQSILLLVFPIFLIFTSWQHAIANDVVAGIQSSQQKKTIVKGVVKDEKGEPLIGVSIALKNSTQGTMTDIDGNYSISIETEKSGTDILIHWIYLTNCCCQWQNRNQYHSERRKPCTKRSSCNCYGYHA